ncbi:hypothetical protein Syun_011438 [Stephania yunnanensis]|uniref:Uncharacterized protein n=1 Tax=Stephania yunnanensis TaxID=152371 RepID=A0AAP0JYS3_9MAGN
MSVVALAQSSEIERGRERTDPVQDASSSSSDQIRSCVMIRVVVRVQTRSRSPLTQQTKKQTLTACSSPNPDLLTQLSSSSVRLSRTTRPHGHGPHAQAARAQLLGPLTQRCSAITPSCSALTPSCSALSPALLCPTGHGLTALTHRLCGTAALPHGSRPSRLTHSSPNRSASRVTTLTPHDPHDSHGHDTVHWFSTAPLTTPWSGVVTLTVHGAGCGAVSAVRRDLEKESYINSNHQDYETMASFYPISHTIIITVYYPT